MSPLELVRLTPLIDRTGGRPDVTIGLIDGPVATSHPDLAGSPIRAIPGGRGVGCTTANRAACAHGTFVAGILVARRGSVAPAVCPGCTLLVRPIFDRADGAGGELPSATPVELARAILDCVDAGARVLNVSAAIVHPALKDEPALDQALDQAARRGVLVVVAAGNQGSLGSTALTRHPWVVPVVAYDRDGRPTGESNLGSSIGRRGLGAPGDRVTSLGADGGSLTLGGTSAAAPFVTGAVALLWSEFPGATAAEIKLAITRADPRRRTTVVPPLLDAWGSYQFLSASRARARTP